MTGMVRDMRPDRVALGALPGRVVLEHHIVGMERTEAVEVLRAKGYRGPTTVIPNGIDEDPTASYGGEKKRRILVVTRMFERKGIQYFLRALQGMKLHHEVHVVGDGPYLPTLRALAEELGVDARFWGWLDRGSAELRNLYDSAEIYVFPSEAENFPLVLLEAMRAGAAIITTKGTGCAEVVVQGGRRFEARSEWVEPMEDRYQRFLALS